MAASIWLKMAWLAKAGYYNGNVGVHPFMQCSSNRYESSWPLNVIRLGNINISMKSVGQCVMAKYRHQLAYARRLKWLSSWLWRMAANLAVNLQAISASRLIIAMKILQCGVISEES